MSAPGNEGSKVRSQAVKKLLKMVLAAPCLARWLTGRGRTGQPSVRTMWPGVVLCQMSGEYDTSVRQHYKSEHWAPCPNQTSLWYDWKIVENILFASLDLVHTFSRIHWHKVIDAIRQTFCCVWCLEVKHKIEMALLITTEPHHEKTCLTICEQERCRSACASVQSDQCLCYSLLR